MKESDWAILDILYREHNITKAAELLYMTQPSLTKRLKQIELEFQTAIAIRNPKGIVFTPQGEYLAQKAGEMVKQFKEIRRQVMEMNDGTSGKLKLGVTNSYGRFRLPVLLNKYKSQYPKVEFDIVSGLSGDIVSMVQQKELYVGFVRGDHAFEGVKHVISVDQGLVVYSRKIELSDLPFIPRIEYGLDPLTVKFLDKWWYECFTAPPLRGMIVNHGETCREMIANGLGYGIFLVPDFLEGAKGLYQLPMVDKNKRPVTRNTWIICNSESYRIPLVRNFVEFVHVQSHCG